MLYTHVRICWDIFNILTQAPSMSPALNPPISLDEVNYISKQCLYKFVILCDISMPV